MPQQTLLSLDDIRLGDDVRLRNGAVITVRHKTTSYTDASGEHEGPFVTAHARGSQHHWLLSDVAEIVTRNERLCRICGEGVTSSKPETDFCEMCYYTGRFHEDERRELLDLIRGLEGVESASVWHTGGGCFVVAVKFTDGRLATLSAGYEESGKVSAEPIIPEAGSDQRWMVVCSQDEDAWDEWDEERIGFTQKLYDDETLVRALADLGRNPGILEVGGRTE